jgi:hypothetical protein
LFFRKEDKPRARFRLATGDREFGAKVEMIPAKQKSGAKPLKTNNPRTRRNEMEVKPLKTNKTAKSLIRRS